MHLIQQTPNCSDLDVVPSGQSERSFRVLLPERVHAQGLQHEGGFHVIPGTWTWAFEAYRGRFAVGEALSIEVRIAPGVSDLAIGLAITNTGPGELTDVWADVCLGVNHLPGDPGWANQRFIPSVPLDRSHQGQHWYERVTPRGLFALTSSGWVPMHPNPARPTTEGVAPYRIIVSEQADAYGCAVQSADGKAWLYQAWHAPSRWCAPFHGNACMHLRPLVANSLEPGQSASIRGAVGLHEGNRESLAEKLRCERGVQRNGPR